MHNKSADLQQLLTLSNAMLECARSASWNEIAELEVMRRELLDAFFLSPFPDELALTVTGGIQSILAIDHEIMALCRMEKHELEQVLQQIEQGKKAIKAYSS
jgi:hypothetical protein